MLTYFLTFINNIINTNAVNLKKKSEGFDKLALKSKEERISDISGLFIKGLRKNEMSKVYYDVQNEISKKIRSNNLSRLESSGMSSRPFSKGNATRAFSRGTISTASTNIFSTRIKLRVDSPEKIQRNDFISMSQSPNYSVTNKKKDFAKNNKYINIRNFQDLQTVDY